MSSQANSGMMKKRQTRRDIYDEATRLSLLEADVDELEVEVIGVRDSLRKMTQALLAAALAMAGSAILVAVTIGAG